MEYKLEIEIFGNLQVPNLYSIIIKQFSVNLLYNQLTLTKNIKLSQIILIAY